METVRWGVLSTARIGRKRLLPAIAGSQNGRLAAIASRDEAQAAAVAATFGPEVRAHGSYEALLADPEINAIYNPLPNSLHAEWTIQALRAGKPVLCEKPLAATVAEAEAMVAAATETGQLLMEAFMYRFHPRIERLLALVAEGAIGPLRAVRSAFTFPLEDSGNVRFSAGLAGGALMDVGCYCVNAARTVLGADPLAASAVAHFGAEGEGVDETLSGLLHFAGGVAAHFDCSLRAEPSQFVELLGADGMLRADGAFNPGEVGVLTLQHFEGGRLVREERFPNPDQWQLMVEHFAEAVLGRAPLRYSAREAVGNMASIEALLQSARTGTTVPLAG